jgi:hypothetical protein
MARSFSRRAAFSEYGVALLNTIRDWSGISADRRTVAVSLWRHELVGPAGAMVYEKLNTDDWSNRGKRLFLEHLQFAVDQCGGLVRVVVSVRDEQDHARTSDCYPAPNVVMRIVHLDGQTGAFRLEQVLTDRRAA